MLSKDAYSQWEYREYIYVYKENTVSRELSNIFIWIFTLSTQLILSLKLGIEFDKFSFFPDLMVGYEEFIY